MTWTKIPAELPDDPELLALPRGIRWMHIEAMIWSNKHGTDGRIPAFALPRITDEPDSASAAGALAAAGKWEDDGEGWLIVGFLDNQPSAADVGRTQSLTRERQRRQRQHKNGDHSLCDQRYCQVSRVTNGVTNGVSHDTRTDPYRTDRKGGEGRGGDEARSARPTPSADAPGSGSGEPYRPVAYGPPPEVLAKMIADLKGKLNDRR